MMMRKLGFLTIATALMLAACNGAGSEKLPDDNMSEIGNLSENTDIAITPPPVTNVTEPSNATAEAAPAPGFTEEQQMKDDADATGMTARLPDETPELKANETRPAE
jgi:hypothetical protein